MPYSYVNAIMSTLATIVNHAFIIFNYFSRYWVNRARQNTKYSLCKKCCNFDNAGKFHLPACAFCTNYRCLILLLRVDVLFCPRFPVITAATVPENTIKAVYPTP